jgi:cytochrome c oxidase cbb3-type subunit I
MSAPVSPILDAAAQAGRELDVSSAAIDASCRWPLLVFFVKGAGWLVVGTFLLFFASIKLHGPGFFADYAWLGLGRVQPAAMTALLYGFASQVGFGLLLWMLCRLGRTVLLNAPFLFVAGAVWNVGVFLGFVGILTGAGTGFSYLEMPSVAWPFLFVALGVIALWGLLNFHCRRDRTLYVSQWFLVAALFWLPWILTVGYYLLLFQPVRGVMQAVVDVWFVQNFLGLWLASIGLAVLYYFLPKLSGRPLYSRQVAAFGFWTLAFFNQWAGPARLGGGPLPNWLISTGIAATVLLLVPLICVGINVHMTLEGDYKQVKEKPALKFVLFGAAAYVVAGGLSALTAFRTVDALTAFTQVPVALDHLLLLGFFAMTAFGAIYEIMPRVTRVAWPSQGLIRLHFNCSAGGVLLYALGLIVGGLVQGSRLSQPGVEFMTALQSSIPFIGIATLGLMIFLVGQFAFAMNLRKLAWQFLHPYLKAICPFQAAADAAKAEAKS